MVSVFRNRNFVFRNDGDNKPGIWRSQHYYLDSLSFHTLRDIPDLPFCQTPETKEGNYLQSVSKADQLSIP